MKIRTGFVSNSSSSSFTLALDKSKKKKLSFDFEVKKTYHVDLNDFIYRTCETIEQLEKYFSEFFTKKSYQKNDVFKISKKSIEAGKIVCFGSLEVNGNGGSQIEQTIFDSKFRNLKLPEGIEIIEDCDNN